MKELSFHDQRNLEGAHGWLGLGNPQEARIELERIGPEMRERREVLATWYLVEAAAQNWARAAAHAQTFTRLFPNNPFGWVQAAFAAHELKQTEEAKRLLETVASKFPQHYVIPYNLACYTCHLGELEAAWGWLKKAKEIGGRVQIEEMALNDRDLAPLWNRLSTTPLRTRRGRSSRRGLESVR